MRCPVAAAFVGVCQIDNNNGLQPQANEMSVSEMQIHTELLCGKQGAVYVEKLPLARIGRERHPVGSKFKVTQAAVVEHLSHQIPCVDPARVSGIQAGASDLRHIALPGGLAVDAGCFIGPGGQVDSCGSCNISEPHSCIFWQRHVSPSITVKRIVSVTIEASDASVIFIFVCLFVVERASINTDDLPVIE